MTAKTPRRAGFSLLELMVVIAIIAVLIGMVAVAVSGAGTSQQRKNTDVLLRKIDSLLKRQWPETGRLMVSKPPQSIIDFAKASPTDDNNDPLVKARAELIWIKVQKTREFPMSYDEARNPAGYSGIPNLSPNDLPPIDAYLKAFGNRRSTGSAAENAACLYITLQQNRNGSGMIGDTELGAAHVADTDGDGVKEVVDGWGMPVVYYRWSSLNADVDGLVKKRTDPNDLTRDTEDPDKRLMSDRWNASPNGILFSNRIHPIHIHPIQPGTTPRAASYYSQPVAVSAGQDKQYGVGRFAQITDPAQDQDNRWSHKLR